MKMWKEFRAFALKRNAMDLAIGVVLGSAFQKMVDALVQQVLMPPLNWLSGNVNTTDWVVTMGEIPFGIGVLVNSMLQFGLIAITVFMFVKALNRLQARKPDQPSEPKKDASVELLREIRDILKKQ